MRFFLLFFLVACSSAPVPSPINRCNVYQTLGYEDIYSLCRIQSHCERVAELVGKHPSLCWSKLKDVTIEKESWDMEGTIAPSARRSEHEPGRR